MGFLVGSVDKAPLLHLEHADPIVTSGLNKLGVRFLNLNLDSNLHIKLDIFNFQLNRSSTTSQIRDLNFVILKKPTLTGLEPATPRSEVWCAAITPQGLSNLNVSDSLFNTQVSRDN